MPAQLARDVSTLADAVARLPSLITQLDVRIQGLAADLTVVRDTVTALAGPVELLAVDVAATQRTVAHADDRVDRLASLVEELAQRVAHIDDGLDDRIPDLTPLPADVHRITRDVARVLELTPDPNEPGALDKVREALTPGS